MVQNLVDIGIRCLILVEELVESDWFRGLFLFRFFYSKEEVFIFFLVFFEEDNNVCLEVKVKKMEINILFVVRFENFLIWKSLVCVVYNLKKIC